MMTVEKLKDDILNYYATIKAFNGRSLGVRDFNAQLMSGTFDAESREALTGALEALVDEQLLVRCSPTEYSLTRDGVVAAHAARERTASALDARRR
ncbi:MAG TPA: hypothetical protein VFK48_02615 [Usitatibacter sp.]|nr:hypothetical protein [Usitatibacter sp.]